MVDTDPAARWEPSTPLATGMTKPLAPTGKERVRNLHEKHGQKVIKHCCGNVNRLVDVFIELDLPNCCLGVKAV